MRETLRSIRLYFGLVGVLSGIINGLMLVQGLNALNFLIIIVGGFGVVLALAFLIMAFILPSLMPNGAPIPKTVIGINCAFLLGLIALQLAVLPPEQAGGAAVKPVIGLLICWYLWANLSRLSKEQDEKFA